MKTHVVKTNPDASISEAVDLMDIYQVSAMPVVDAEGRFCGMISETDVARAVASAIDPEGRDSEADAITPLQLHRAIASQPVRALMRANVPSVSELSDSVDTIRLFFVNNHVRLAVTDAFGAVVGTLNRIDILQAVLDGSLSGGGK